MICVFNFFVFDSTKKLLNQLLSWLQLQWYLGLYKWVMCLCKITHNALLTLLCLNPELQLHVPLKQITLLHCIIVKFLHLVIIASRLNLFYLLCALWCIWYYILIVIFWNTLRVQVWSTCQHLLNFNHVLICLLLTYKLTHSGINKTLIERCSQR